MYAGCATQKHSFVFGIIASPPTGLFGGIERTLLPIATEDRGNNLGVN
jgi:hypothetical protein